MYGLAALIALTTPDAMASKYSEAGRQFEACARSSGDAGLWKKAGMARYSYSIEPTGFLRQQQDGVPPSLVGQPLSGTTRNLGVERGGSQQGCAACGDKISWTGQGECDGGDFASWIFWRMRSFATPELGVSTPRDIGPEPLEIAAFSPLYRARAAH